MRLLVGIVLGSIGAPLVALLLRRDPIELYALVAALALIGLLLVGLAGCYLADAGHWTRAGVARRDAADTHERLRLTR